LNAVFSNPSVKGRRWIMTKLITVDRAKAEIKRLQNFVNLVESYEADTLDKAIIKEYAFTNSIVEVTKRLNVDRKYVTVHD
jgi:hypothetical protein